jgi:chromosome partitioning protein
MAHPYVITISSEKGGVGKTTLATNLAIYLKGIREDLPVTLFSFDNHFSVDKMFRIRKSNENPSRDISQLLTGEENAENLIEIGEFGVQFIPSHKNLSFLREQTKNPDILAKSLARSDMAGIVIIDTRPDLDFFTQNALFAADLVIIPVKDAPSLENCKHIFEFVETHGISKRKLLILPCLLDSRVRFEGTFRNLYDLVRAYAINRGYRCFQGYISRSAKVEALNTNPQGKIFPIITHGKNTEVHQQFKRLAGHLIGEYLSAGTENYRIRQIRGDLDRCDLDQRDFITRRKAMLNRICPICDAEHAGTLDSPSSGDLLFYECSDGSTMGVIHEQCYIELILRYFFQSDKKQLKISPSLQNLFRESAKKTFFVFRNETANPVVQTTFFRFDDEGKEMSRRSAELKPLENSHFGFFKTVSPLYSLISKTLLDGSAKPKDAFILIRSLGSDQPDLVFDQKFSRSFGSMLERVQSYFLSLAA